MTKDIDQKTGQGKTCSKCGEWKLLSEYHKRSDSNIGTQSHCKRCRAETKKLRASPGWVSDWERKWTDEKILEAALKYKTRSSFRKGNISAYAAAVKSDLGLSHFCGHMDYINRYWSFEDIMVEALKFETVRDFRINNLAAYTAALRSGRKDEIYSHMINRNAHADRYVYMIESSDNLTAYVGLSINPRRRYNEHKRTGTKKVKDLLAGVHTFRVVSGPFSEDVAARVEGEEVDKLMRRGVAVLNAVKAGSLGSIGDPKWTYETVMVEAKKHDNIASLQRSAGGAYNAAVNRLGGIRQFCSHMKLLNRWDAESIANIAKLHNTRAGLEKASPSAANAARRLGIMDDVCAHMKPPKWMNIKLDAAPTLFDCLVTAANDNHSPRQQEDLA